MSMRGAWRRHVNRSSFVLPIGVAAVLTLSGCAGVDPPPGAAADASAAAGIPEVRTELTAAEETQCASPDLRARLDAALSAATEGSHNSILATPDEVAQLGAEAIDRQKRAWDALDEQELLWQLCLRDRQESPAG